VSLLTIPFPAIDPVLVSFGPLAIRWYSLAYIAGLMIAWRMMRRLGPRLSPDIKIEAVDDFIVWATLGVILGGRLGFVVFYGLPFYAQNPLEILAVWKGGMSFHGGFLGVCLAAWLFCRKHGIRPLVFGDLLATVSPAGIFFGRIANFINAEHFGRATDVPWAMVFPRGGPDPRHPSQLYEAALEGALLFVVLNLMFRIEAIRTRAGVLTGTFLAGYAVARMSLEMVRVPDGQIGPLTIGQWLSLPMLLIGLALIVRGWKREA